MIQLLAAGSGNSSALNDVEPGLLGFLVVAGLALALVFLLRSMNKQFRKIGPGPQDTAEMAAATADEARDGEAAAGAVRGSGAAGDGLAAQDAAPGTVRDAGAAAPDKG